MANLDTLENWKRSLYCGELRTAHVGQQVTLMGWVDRRRDHGGVIFIDLRDRSGKAQIVFNPSKHPQAHKKGEQIRNEYVVAVRGVVEPRPEGMVNEKLPTGQIEVMIDEVKILNEAKSPPIQVNEPPTEGEDTRLRYRYLDLRRPENQHKLIMRHKITQNIRQYLSAKGFLEIETPILMKSTPEGARDFLVPSRLNKGTFYALPQSPQTYKQILMVAGFDRYFQVPRCFRDEDLRADRQPEFTQVDCELSFVQMNDIYEVFDSLLENLFREILGVKVTLPILRMSYAEAMRRFASDKPDLRFGLEMDEIQDLVEKYQGKGIPFFEKAVSQKGIVKVMKVDAQWAKDLSRSELERLESEARALGAAGLGYARIEEGGTWKSPLAKFVQDQSFRAETNERIKAAAGDLIFFNSGPAKIVNTVMNALRLELGRKFNLVAKDEFRFLWVTEFPMFEYSEEEKRWAAMHHPFTSPTDEDTPALFTDEYHRAKAKAYDIVLNGNEIGGGSIRIHNQDLQKRVFHLLGIGDEEARNKFGFLLDALEYGAPPHGGIAFGLDRLVMLMLGLDSIREVIAFAKTSTGASLMDGCPSEVSVKQLKELGIRVDRA